MERRNFLRLAIGGIAAATAVRTFPFRVYSFPTDIVIPNREEFVYFLPLSHGYHDPREWWLAPEHEQAEAYRRSMYPKLLSLKTTYECKYRIK